jgi:hypothetical protein
VAIDLNRVVATAIDTALHDGSPHEPRRQKRSGFRTLLAGAGLALAARAAVKRAPDLPGLPRLSEIADLPDEIRDRLADRGWLDGDDDEDYDDEPVASEEEEDDDEDEDDFDDEPEAEAEEDDLDEDEDDEPDEPELEEEQDEAEEESPPGLARSNAGEDNGVDPVMRPPEPPEEDAVDSNGGSGSKRKTKAATR